MYLTPSPVIIGDTEPRAFLPAVLKRVLIMVSTDENYLKTLPTLFDCLVCMDEAWHEPPTFNTL